MQVVQIYLKKFRGPSAWAEVNAAMLLLISQVLVCRKLDDKQTRHQLAMRLFSIPVSFFKQLPESYKILLHPTIDWVFTKNCITKWLIKRVFIGDQTFYGPKDKLADMTGEEFMQCELEYGAWLNTQNPLHLNTIAAVLYRKKGFFSRKRVDFDAEKLASHEKTMAGLKPWVKYAIAANYSGVRNLMIDLHPFVWRVALEAELPGQSAPTSWASLFLELAGGKFGPYPDTIKTQVWLLLKDLNRKAELAEKSRRPN